MPACPSHTSAEIEKPHLMIHPSRLTLLAALTLGACGGSTDPPGDPPAVAGTYDVTGESDNALGSQFTFAGPLVLTQAGDPPGETLGGTLTLTYSVSQWSIVTVTLSEASVDGNGILTFFATTSAGGAIWRGTFNGADIVNGRFGCQECYSGTWQAKRRSLTAP
jgi:hypothetical protein